MKKSINGRSANPLRNGSSPTNQKPRNVCGLLRGDLDNDFMFSRTIPLWFSISVTVFLWLTLLFANFAEAVAEGRGKAQAG